MRVFCVPYFCIGVQIFVIIGFGMAQVEYTYFFPPIWTGFVYAESNILECFIRLGQGGRCLWEACQFVHQQTEWTNMAVSDFFLCQTVHNQVFFF
jgi:hypothetical protein